MTNDEFLRITTRLLNWFGKSNMKAEQKTLMFQMLEHIPAEAYQGIVSDMIESSKAFPTIGEIKNQYRWKWKDRYPEKEPRQYNPNETDLEYYSRITITYLWTAYNILKNQGDERFLNYCNANHISEEDVERVRNKLNMINTKNRPDVKTLTEDIGGDTRTGRTRT